MGLELTTFVVITTDGIGSSKSNYNAIPATTVPNYQFKIQMKCKEMKITHHVLWNKSDFNGINLVPAWQ